MTSGRLVWLLTAPLILLVFGLPIGWLIFNGRLRASERPSLAANPAVTIAAKPGVISAEQRNSDAKVVASLQPNDLARSTVKANSQRGDQKFSGVRTPVIETLPNSLAPSKIGRQFSDRIPVAAQNEATGSATNFAGQYENPNGTRVPLASLPALPPRLDHPPEPVTEVPAEPAVTRLTPTHVVQPEYPKLARLRHIEGDVLLELEVDSNGRVRKVRSLNGDPSLKEAAEEAALKWRFASSPGNETAEPVTTQIRFNFRLR